MSNTASEDTTALSKRLVAAFPSQLRTDVLEVVGVLPVGGLASSGQFGAIIAVERVTIPYRIYNPPMDERTVAGLSVEQQVIVHCLYSRHHDGFVRQAHIEQVLGDERAWVIPFVLRLLGEYVIEIVEIIDRALATGPRIAMYQHFADANPDFVALTKQQATSYWNAYYRDHFLDRDDYPTSVALSADYASRRYRNATDYPALRALNRVTSAP